MEINEIMLMNSDLHTAISLHLVTRYEFSWFSGVKSPWWWCAGVPDRGLSQTSPHLLWISGDRISYICRRSLNIAHRLFLNFLKFFFVINVGHISGVSCPLWTHKLDFSWNPMLDSEEPDRKFSRILMSSTRHSHLNTSVLITGSSPLITAGVNGCWRASRTPCLTGRERRDAMQQKPVEHDGLWFLVKNLKCRFMSTLTANIFYNP